MAFTAKYADLATLVQSSVFQSRIAGAVANYAKFTLGNNAATLSQKTWAKSAVFSPAATAGQIAWLCAIDPAFAGQATSPIDPSAAGVSDATLDSVVQTAINTSVLQF